MSVHVLRHGSTFPNLWKDRFRSRGGAGGGESETFFPSPGMQELK